VKKKRKLTIELVPKTSWYSNVRSNVTRAEWDKIRKKSYAHANHKCEVCGATGKEQGFKHNVECHEIWEYTNDGTQKLIGLISLCPHCHKVKHPGLAQMKGELDIVVNQLMKVNEIDTAEAMFMLNEAFDVWRKRSQQEWDLDISYLEEYMS
jgi:hypothetical protein